MFSKSKRFDDKPVGCGADANYDIKSIPKPKGGVIPKVERFSELKNTNSVNSDSESVCSDISSRVFRTPKSIRRVVLSTKKCETEAERKNFLEDLLSAKKVEIRNKDETINEYEKQISELKNTIFILQNDIKIKTENEEKNTNIIQEIEENLKKRSSEINELKENLALIKTQHALALEANESIRHEYSENNSKFANKNKSLQVENESMINLTKELESKCRDYKDKNYDYENEIINLKDDLKKAIRERHVYSLSLDSAQKTVEALSTRLTDSYNNNEVLNNELEKIKLLNSTYEDEIVELQIEFSSFKDEYTELLTSIVNSKSKLDKYHHEILSNNTEMLHTLDELKTNAENKISSVKIELLNNLNNFKEKNKVFIEELHNKLIEEKKKSSDLKDECDSAYVKIDECHNLLYNAENLLESKDHDINELETENNRISGTLAATEQEKNELQFLLNEYSKLLEMKDNKISDYIKKINKQEQDIEDATKNFNQFSEAMNFIIREKICEIDNCNEEINQLFSEKDKLESDLNIVHSECQSLKKKSNKYEETIKELTSEVKSFKDLKHNYDSLQCSKSSSKNSNVEIDTLKREIQKLESHTKECKEESLEKHCKNLETELRELAEKYSNLLGHQNNKQKIKHVVDLKQKNAILKEENEKLTFTIQKQGALIDKLKRETGEMNFSKSPYPKKLLTTQGSQGKENVTPSPFRSPNTVNGPKSERPLTPLQNFNY